MGCESCGSGSKGKAGGCKSNGRCGTGSCNRLNSYDWLADIVLPEDQKFDIVEMSFRNGSRKEFFRNSKKLQLHKGEPVVVESKIGFDLGEVSLTGELVKLQMKKKKVKPNSKDILNIVRHAREEDIQKWSDAKALEQGIMLQARAIARTLNLDMKVSDVNLQPDKRKATFYYIADQRVDFRELIKTYAKEFKVKVEMRQIGARQEAGRIGGIGSCGRELCCSTWLTNFKSVSTQAARYQQLSINQTKLSGQCGRLKCCLNYELDQYQTALKDFPKADSIKTKEGKAYKVKIDIFKGLIWYKYGDKNTHYPLTTARVKEILEMNKKGEFPESLMGVKVDLEPAKKDYDADANVELVGQVSLGQLNKFAKPKKSKNYKGKSSRYKKKPSSGQQPQSKDSSTQSKSSSSKPKKKRYYKPKKKK